jgi:16S rRNA (cytidine1402-2'-O)-methyltransferase
MERQREILKTQTGTLFLVAVPVGCPEDISLRALSVLRSVGGILAENPHVTRSLLQHHGIEGNISAYRPRTDPDCDSNTLQRLLSGESLALVSDAGTPALVDPGQTLITAAVRAGIPIVPIPGAAAMISALIVSGLPTGRFVFDGSPPRSRTDRAQFFANLKDEPRTILLYESPAYLRSTLRTLAETLGADRGVCVAFSLTTSKERIFRGTLAEACEHFRKPMRGEYALAVAGRSPNDL